MLKEHRLQLLHALNECNIHLKRLNFAREKISPLIPLTPENYDKIEEKKENYMDTKAVDEIFKALPYIQKPGPDISLLILMKRLINCI